MAVNALVTKQKTFKAYLEGPGVRECIAKELPKHMKVDRVIQVVLLAASRNPKLYDCTFESLLKSIMTAKEYGLDPGGALGHGFLVPYWNGKINKMECQFIAGYRGLITLARNSGEVNTITARVVHENDRFRAIMGLHEDLIHEPNLDDPGEATFVYAIATFKDGPPQWEVISRRQIEAIKARSKSRTKEGELTGPWVTDEEEMWRKTVVRRLVKYLPLSVEARDAIERDDEAEFHINEMRNITPTKAEMTQALNAPSEPPIELDLSGIKEAEAEPMPPDAEPAPEQKRTRKATPEPISDPAVGPAEQVLNPHLVEKLDAIAKHGVTRSFLENYYNSPAYEWRMGVVKAIDLATSKLTLGASIAECFPTVHEVPSK